MRMPAVGVGNGTVASSAAAAYTVCLLRWLLPSWWKHEADSANGAPSSWKHE